MLNFGNMLPLVIATVALVVTLAVSVPAAMFDLSDFNDRVKMGEVVDFLELRRIRLRARIRRELFRVVKHILAVTGAIVALTTAVWHVMDFVLALKLCGYVFMCIAVMMLLNTILDVMVERKVNHHLKLQGTHL